MIEFMIFLICTLIFTVSSTLHAHDFSKGGFFSLFGYNPLISAEEKELGKLHGNAESAMQKKDFAPAEKAFEEILKRIDPPFLSTSKFKVDWPTYVDTILRLAEAKLALKRYEEGMRLLERLEEVSIPQEYLPSIYFLMARYLALQNDPGAAYVKMKMALKILPVEKWRGEDRSFFHGIEYLLNDHFDTLAKKARRYQLAHHTQDAIKMYQEILSAIQNGHYPIASHSDAIHLKRVKWRLAELYYEEACYEKTLALIETTHKSGDQIDCEMLYLAACALREKQDYEQAIECFQHYVDDSPSVNEHVFLARLEIGISHYQKNRLDEAKKCFEILLQLECKGKTRETATFYLSRIYLKEGKANQVLTLLEPLCCTQKEEVSYLLGEAYYQLHQFDEAKAWLERALAAQREWRSDALYRLALCHEHLGNPLKAEKILLQLIENEKKEIYILTLAKMYLSNQQCDLLETLLNSHNSFFSRNGQAEALLLLAESKKNMHEKSALLLAATDTRFEETPVYPECLYRKGVHDFKQGNFGDSIDAFEKAFHLIGKKDQEVSSHLLHCLSSSKFYRGMPQEALIDVETLMNTLPPSEDLLYLRGLIAVALDDVENIEHSLAKIEQSSKWHPGALFALGSYYFRHQKYVEASEKFDTLHTLYAHTPIASAALFWHGETLEKMGQDGNSLRRKCYQDYPFSHLAPLAYFKIYPFESYLEGNSEATQHIYNFPQLFPNSPLALIAYYFIGQAESDPKNAIAAYEKGNALFDQTCEKIRENKTLLLYFHYRTLFELAGKLIQQEHPLAKITAQLESGIKEIERNESIHSLLEEGKYMLSLCYLEQDLKKNAGEILLHLTSNYHDTGVHEGYFLSKVLMAQGQLALKQDEYEKAITLFDMAETSGQKHLPISEKMRLWLLYSECFKRQQKWDQAMKMLSRVINQEIESPLREKAMFLRAEIYECSGRHELAIRQLESTAKRGGKWGERAKMKLDLLHNSIR